jgi:hypothetical protein
MSQGNYESISIREAMDKINNEGLDSFDWVEILSSHPEFADKCNWDVFSDGGYHDLRLLLDSQPQFADRVLDCIGHMEAGFAFPELIEAAYANCPAPAEFLSRLRGDVLSELKDDINSERQYGEEGGYSHECVAARLVGKIPELTADFDFGEWKGRAIALLLAARPELAERCNLGALAGADWAKLLAIRPEFADRCKWESLSEDDWLELLEAAPRFADHPAWLATGKSVEALREKPRDVFLRFVPDWAGGCSFGFSPLGEVDNPGLFFDVSNLAQTIFMLPMRAVVMQALRPDGAIVGEWLIDPLARGGNPVQLIEKDGPFDAMPETMPGSWLCGLAGNCCGAIWSNDPRIAYEKDRVQPLSVRGAFNPADLTLPWSVIRSASYRYLVIHVRELQYRGVSVHLEDEDICRADEPPDWWIVENGTRKRVSLDEIRRTGTGTE